jgi:hypothetical protein
MDDRLDRGSAADTSSICRSPGSSGSCSGLFGWMALAHYVLSDRPIDGPATGS